MNNDKKIILITELVEQRLKKQQELEYYIETKKNLENKILLLNKEIQITNFIIKLLNNESKDLMVEYLKGKNWDYWDEEEK